MEAPRAPHGIGRPSKMCCLWGASRHGTELFLYRTRRGLSCQGLLVSPAGASASQNSGLGLAACSSSSETSTVCGPAAQGAT